MRRIGVVGAGCIGKLVKKRFEFLGDQVLATTTSKERLDELKPALLYKAGDKNSLGELLSQSQIVIATLAPSGYSSYEEVYLRFVEDLEELIPLYPNIQSLIYTSSTSVYGERGGEWVDEMTPPNPNTASGKLLLEVENRLSALPIKNFTCFRLGEICTKQRPFKEKIQCKVFPGTGENFTNLIHEEDIISAILFALSINLKGIYNLVNDLHVPRNELYRMIANKFSLEEPRFDSKLTSPHGGNKRVSNEKIKRSGFQFLYPGLDACLM